MSVVPRQMLQKIQWFENHVTPWNTNAAAIGTTTTEATAFQTKTEAARAALTAAETARQTAKDATLTLQTAVEAADIAAAGIIKQVRSKAETTNNPGVYALASIPAPATPSPVGAPGTPGNFEVALGVDGSLTLKWKCANPVGCVGVVYQLWRRSSPTSAFSFIGATGIREFVDSAIPANSTQITYQLQATRSTSAGPWAQVNVNFGTGSGGVTTASVVETSPAAAKVAA